MYSRTYIKNWFRFQFGLLRPIDENHSVCLQCGRTDIENGKNDDEDCTIMTIHFQHFHPTLLSELLGD